MGRFRQQYDERERVKKEHFINEIKENLYTCYVCGAELWDEKKHHLKYRATYRFKGRRTGDLLFACAECRTLVATIRADELSKDEK